MPTQERRLGDLISIGPATLRDFELLGIRSVKQLARQNPVALYKKLCCITGQRVDICCQDVFTAAVAQARNPLLPAEQCQWWYWSRHRIAQKRLAPKSLSQKPLPQKKVAPKKPAQATLAQKRSASKRKAQDARS